MKNSGLKLVYGIFAFLTFVAVIVRLILENKGMHEQANVFTWVSLSLLVVALLIRVFDMFFPNLGKKPTREEIEEQVFDKNKS